jgi:hypothetical protein
MNARKMIPALLVAMATLFLGACGTSTLHIELPTPTPKVLADCFLSFQIAAWQDLDEDGLWDTTEPPLEGVEFRLQGTFAQMWGAPYLSKADGRLTITTWSPGRCGEQDYAITAVPPESYEPTTPASIAFSLTSVDSFYEAQFGFRAVPK